MSGAWLYLLRTSSIGLDASHDIIFRLNVWRHPTRCHCNAWAVHFLEVKYIGLGYALKLAGNFRIYFWQCSEEVCLGCQFNNAPLRYILTPQWPNHAPQNIPKPSCLMRIAVNKKYRSMEYFMASNVNGSEMCRHENAALTRKICMPMAETVIKWFNCNGFGLTIAWLDVLCTFE